MELQEVLQIIAAGEGQCIEFKESFAEEDEAINSLCAFAHSEGGTVLFGVCNDGRIRGVSLGKNTLENFASKLRSCAQPPLIASINEMLVAGKNIICVTVGKARDDQVLFSFGKAYIRISKTNQLMSPDEIRDRYFVGFKAENLEDIKPENRALPDTESWDERETRRCNIYEMNRGLFLVHTWRPSQEPGQIADVVISIAQHDEGPLTLGTVKSVEYHLGPKFFDRTIVKSDSSNRFRLEVSAYGPMLCLARVHFDDGTPSLELQRYIDFWPSSNEDTWAQEKTERSIQSLIEILNYIDEYNDLNLELPWGDSVKTEIQGRLAESFYNLTKLLSDTYNATNSWTPKDRELLLEQREQGLKDLIDLYRQREDRYKEYLGNSYD